MTVAAAPIAGLVLAAGAGTRYGGPKALAHGASWLRHAAQTLLDAGCTPVIVVLGAGGREAQALLGERPGLLVVHAEDWAEGLSASLRAGLREASALEPRPVAVAVVPVDVPDLSVATVARLVGALPGRAATNTEGSAAQAPGVAAPDAAADSTAPTTEPYAAGSASVHPDTLRQARFAGRPGHPVVIGRSHWAPLIESLAGDTGARPYLRMHPVEMIECGDLGTGLDVDERAGQPTGQ